MSTDDFSAVASRRPDLPADGADFGSIDDHLGDEFPDDPDDPEDAAGPDQGLARDISL